MLHFDEEPTTRRRSRTANRTFVTLDQLPDPHVWANPEAALIAEEEAERAAEEEMFQAVSVEMELLTYLELTGGSVATFKWARNQKPDIQVQSGGPRNSRQMMTNPINDLVH